MEPSIRLDCDAVVFDLDGVLVDSGAAVVEAWNRLAGELGMELTGDPSELHGIRTVDALPGGLSGDERARAVARLEDLEVELSTGASAVAGAVELVASLPPRRWGIATSGSRRLALARLEAAGVVVPEVMVTADDVSAGKPDPEPYVAAARALGVPAARTVVFEDAPSGAAAASAAQATVIGVATTHGRAAFPAAAWIDDLRPVRVSGSGPLVVSVG